MHRILLAQRWANCKNGLSLAIVPARSHAGRLPTRQLEPMGSPLAVARSLSVGHLRPLRLGGSLLVTLGLRLEAAGSCVALPDGLGEIPARVLRNPVVLLREEPIEDLDVLADVLGRVRGNKLDGCRERHAAVRQLGV